MNSMMKSVLVWLGIIALLVLAFRQIPQNSRQIEIPFSTFYTEGVGGKYKSVTLSGFDVDARDLAHLTGEPGKVRLRRIFRRHLGRAPVERKQSQKHADERQRGKDGEIAPARIGGEEFQVHRALTS